MPAESDLRLSVVIPAFNEEGRLPHTLESALDFLAAEPYQSEVVVADDGSTDRTAAIAGAHSGGRVPVRLAKQPDGSNHGKGSAVRLGMLAATGRYRLFMDADNSTTVGHVRGFWGAFETGCDVAIGSRNIEGAVVAVHQRFYKEAAGRLGNLLIRLFAVPRIRDTQAGFKMFTAQAAETIFRRLTIDGWGFDVEALMIARVHGLRVRELPIRWENAPGSKVAWHAYFDVLSDVLRIRRNLRRGLYA